MRRIGRFAAKLAIAAGATVIVLAIAGVLLVATTAGRRVLLRLALPLINARMAGHLSIAAIEGDVPGHFILRDARLDDAEGFEAIYARKIEASLDWKALRHRHVRLRELRVEGARLTLRHLLDNRLNLAALAPRRHDGGARQPARAKEPPPLVSIEHFHLQLEGAYFPPRGHEQHRLEWPRGTFDIDGDAWFRGADMHFTVTRFVSDSHDPLRAHVELTGGLRVQPKKAHGHTEITFEHVIVTVESGGDELRRLSPLVRARGRWAVRVEGGGPLANLQAHALVSAPAGHLSVDGGMGRLFPGVRWQAEVHGEGIDPGADWLGLPSGQLRLALRGSGAREQGEIIVDELRGALTGVTLQAAGHSDLRGRGEGELRAHVASLAQLWPEATAMLARRARVEKLAGSVDVRAQLLRDARGPQIVARVTAERLRLRQARVDARLQALAATLRITPAQAPHLTLQARELALAPASVERARERRDGVEGTLPATRSTAEAPSAASAAAKRPPYLRLTTLALDVRGVPRSLAASVTAATADGHAAAALHASLERHGARARIDRLDVQARGHDFHLAVPADLRLTVAGERARVIAAVAGAHAELLARLERRRFAVELSATVPALSRLAAGLTGSLALDGQISVGEELLVRANATARHLRAGGLSLDYGRLGIDTHDLWGTIALHAESLRAGKLALTRLDAQARAGAERLQLAVDGTRPDGSGTTRVALALGGRWQPRGLTVPSADLRLARLQIDLPRQSWSLVQPARLVVDARGLALSGLRARSGLGEIDVDGRLDRTRVVDLRVQLRDGELQELGRVLGRGELLPPARWSGHVHARGSLADPFVDAALTAQAERTVAWYGLAFNSLSLTAFGDRRQAMLHVEARGKDKNRIVVDAHARGDGGALATTIDRLQLAVNQHAWALREPCRLRVSARLEIERCSLGSARAEVSLVGVVPLLPSAPPALDLVLTTRRLDLRDLGALLAPGHKEPPKTSFDARLQLAGTRARPTLDLALAGTGSQVDEGLPENVRYQIRAHYGDGRVAGQASMRQVGVRLGIGARFDLPTRFDGPEEPIALELEARPVPFFKLRNLLPPVLANLQGFFTLRLRASGTTRHPRLDGEFHAPSWGLDDLRDNDTVADFAYDGQRLTVNSVTSFQATTLLASILRIRPKRNSGTIKLALHAPLDLVALVRDPRHALAAFAHQAPIDASMELRAVDLTKVPLQILGFSPPVTAGIVDGSARLSGTLVAPSLHADLRGRKLAKPGVVRDLELGAALAWEHGRADVTGALELAGAPLVAWRGHLLVDGEQLFGGQWRAARLAVDADAPALPLARLATMQPRLHGLDGTIELHASLRGTAGAPSLRLRLSGHGLHAGEAQLAQAILDANYDERSWTLHLLLGEAQGGRLRLDGEWPRDRDRPLALALSARGLDIGPASLLWEEIGELHGTLDGDVTLHGTRAAPRLEGTARLERGRFGLRWDRRRLEDGTLELAFAGDRVSLVRGHVAGGGGALDVHGQARLAGGRLHDLRLAAQARRFAVGYGSASAWLDADFTVEGDGGDGGWRGTLALSRGTIKLPELDGGAAVRRALPDVELVDARAPGRAATPTASLFVRVDHPLELRSRELQIALGGELSAALVGGERRLEGVVEGSDGTMELLGHRYHVERAQLAFIGPPDDPELHLRATRKLGRTTLALIIEGTAKNPSVRVTCDPPIYDEARLVSLVLAGRPDEDRIAVRDLTAKITGLLSALVIRKIEEQLAPTLPIDLVKPLDQQSYVEFLQSPLEVGRFVSDRIYVSYAQRAGSRMGRSPANADEARAEYRLGGGWELDTTFGDQGVGGVYIMWTARH